MPEIITISGIFLCFFALDSSPANDYCLLSKELNRQTEIGRGKGTRFLPGEESCKEASRQTGLKAKTNNLRLSLERRHVSFRAKGKPQASRKNKLVCFSVCPAAFPCALCAQQGRLCRPARKRGTALLFRFAAASFTALKRGFLLLF